MDPAVPSPLEAALLVRFYDLHGTDGFPPPSVFRVRKRENTGVGRYVDFDPLDTQLDDGYLDLGGGYIEMEGVPDGMMAVVAIRSHRVQQMEIVAYGLVPWDGNEREWKISPPVTTTRP
jgi:hypothetical protein